jgi:pimeloyl-ACP methyl ester carboxylesterase
MRHATARLLLALAALATLPTCTAVDAPPVTTSVAAPSAATRPTAAKQTILIVHGAWGGGWAFRDVDARLTAHGYKVVRPTLTGQGERVHLSTPNIGLALHIQDIVNVILFEDLHDVILVGHSYGGMVITGVADRLPDRIKSRIYLDALLPENGESVNALLPERIGQVQPDGYIHPTWRVQPNPPHDVLMPAKTFDDPIKLDHPDALARIPAAYILTVDPGKQPPQDTFYKFYQRAQSYNWPTTMMPNTDHNPQWSKPADLVRTLEQFTH